MDGCDYCLYTLLIYLTVPLCLCVLCGHPSQPGVSCWLTCESTTLLASWALAAIVTISGYRSGLCHDIAILKKSTIWALVVNNTVFVPYLTYHHFISGAQTLLITKVTDSRAHFCCGVTLYTGWWQKPTCLKVLTPLAQTASLESIKVQTHVPLMENMQMIDCSRWWVI